MRENFPPGLTNFFPSKSEGKLWRENVLTMQLLDCPLLMSINSSTVHPYSSTAHPYQIQKINSTPISNPENQQYTHIHQTHIKIHQTHIQIYINNQSEIEKRRKRRRRKKEEDAEENAKITIFSTQNFCFLRPKSLPLIKPNPNHHL